MCFSAGRASAIALMNLQAGRLAADILADAIKRSYADAEGDGLPLSTAMITGPLAVTSHRRSRSISISPSVSTAMS